MFKYFKYVNLAIGYTIPKTSPEDRYIVKNTNVGINTYSRE